ncbi:hypothetical protein Dda_8106 [Drechslerella dactyloides]|uniref:Essential protein Yae1 N-terminal domain-containing protein n=1 Tax=Drechslerella dactyloides TaxID=74499 RepID=A0AAD6IRI8_DREDA|nr:hypothetical protein Dda_8106 [Drechslerella dactyloides]
MATDEVDVDIFDAVLNLEEDFYAVGYREGLNAGRTAGRLEGRALGIEKGFEKYLALGLIRGRTKIWHARTSAGESTNQDATFAISNPRHVKHISALRTLSANPPIRNEEDDVEEVDDRIRRGKAKVKILENTLKESVEDAESTGAADGSSSRSAARSVIVAGTAGLETEVEDFKPLRR